MTFFRPTLLALLLALALTGCGGNDDDAARDANSPGASTTQAAPSFQKEGTLAFVRAGDTLSTLDIEIADTRASQRRGLMQRPSLPVGSGMLFLFPEDDERVRSFWMKNTPMSLDILFASADSEIVRVAKRTKPYSTDQVSSEAPARFVVEVPAGYADRQGIIEGDRIRFRKSVPAGSPLRTPSRADAATPSEAAQ